MGVAVGALAGGGQWVEVAMLTDRNLVEIGLRVEDRVWMLSEAQRSKVRSAN